MEQLNITENVDILFNSLEKFTQSEGVIGKPVIQGDKTFLPVVSLTIGYGGGNSSMGKNVSGQSSTATSTSNGNGAGALGLGAKLHTEAIIVIDNQNVSMMSLNSANASQLMDKIPQMIAGMNQNKQGNQTQQQNQPQP